LHRRYGLVVVLGALAACGGGASSGAAASPDSTSDTAGGPLADAVAADAVAWDGVGWDALAWDAVQDLEAVDIESDVADLATLLDAATDPDLDDVPPRGPGDLALAADVSGTQAEVSDVAAPGDGVPDLPLPGDAAPDAAVDAVDPPDLEPADAEPPDTDPGDGASGDPILADGTWPVDPAFSDEGKPLAVHIKWSLEPYPSGFFRVSIRPPADTTGEYAQQVYDTMTGSGFPTDLAIEAPEGDWIVDVLVVGFVQGPPVIQLKGCRIYHSGVVTIGPTGTQATHAWVHLTEPMESWPGNICPYVGEAVLLPGAQNDNGGAFQMEIFVQPPSTVFGGAHLLHGEASGQLFLVNGYWDGLVTFDFSAPAPPDKPPYWGWNTHPFQKFVRTARTPGFLWATHRTNVTCAIPLDETSGQPGKMIAITAAQGMHLEGLGPRGDLMWIAARTAGLRALSSSPPYTFLDVTSPPELQDAWDVKAVGESHLVVGDGKDGLKILSLANNVYSPALVSQVAIPGYSAFLHVQGTKVYVAALDHGAHVVDLATPAQPKLTGSLMLDIPFYDLRPAGGTLLGSAGHELLLIDETPGGLKVRNGRRSTAWAMGTSLSGGKVYAAEFRAAARYKLDTKLAPGPVLVLPGYVSLPYYSKPAGVSTQVKLRNIGTEPLVVQSVQFMDDPTLPSKTVEIAKDITVDSLDSKLVTLTLPLVKKGFSKHKLVFFANDTGSQPYGMELLVIESDGVQPGEAFPSDVLLLDKQNKQLSLSTLVQGKPTVFVMGSSTCPLAFIELYAMGYDLHDVFASGKVLGVIGDPWSAPGANENDALDTGFVHLFAPPPTSGQGDMTKGLLWQPQLFGPPMPIVYVVGKDGIVRHVQWGYDRVAVKAAVDAMLAEEDGPPP